MAQRRQLLLRALNNPGGLRFGEFVALVEAFGFKLDRQRGSHRLYQMRGMPEFVNIQPRSDGKAAAEQVREFLKLIEAHSQRLEDEP